MSYEDKVERLLEKTSASLPRALKAVPRYLKAIRPRSKAESFRLARQAILKHRGQAPSLSPNIVSPKVQQLRQAVQRASIQNKFSRNLNRYGTQGPHWQGA